MGDALFDTILRMQGEQPWGRVLDAGTGTLEMSRIGGTPGCGIPEHHAAEAAANLMRGSDRRVRYLDLSFYPKGTGSSQAVARSVGRGAVYGSMPIEEDVSRLCAQVTLIDAAGDRELLMEDCDLCASHPEACASGEGCTVGQSV